MGNMGAQMMGMELAPNTLEESTSKTMAIVRGLCVWRYLSNWLIPSQLDSATRENTSGKFINVVDGTEIPW